MNISKLRNSALFKGSTTVEIESMLTYLNTKQLTYKKDEIIYHAGDIVNSIGIVLSGSVTIENNDLWGNKSILSHIGVNQIFAEAYACIPNEPMMVDAVASEACEILVVDISSILQNATSNITYHQRLIHNLISILAHKNLNLSHRITHTSSKSIRGRLISYLSFQVKKQGGNTIVIPFNRQQLANYLSVDRSALSNELSKMQRDGLIDYHKNNFKIKKII